MTDRVLWPCGTGWDLERVLPDILAALRDVLAVLGRRDAELLDPVISALVVGAVRGAQAVHLRQVEHRSVADIAGRLGVTEGSVLESLDLWASGPVDPRWVALGSEMPRRGYTALLTRDVQPSPSFNRTYESLAAAFDADRVREHAAADAIWSESHRRWLAHLLNGSSDLADASEADVVGGLRLLAGRPVGPLEFDETAPDDIYELNRSGMVMGIDGTLIATRDGLMSALLVSVGYPARIATVVIGTESGAVAERALRLVAHDLGGVPKILVFDQHAAYFGKSFRLFAALLGLEPFHPKLIAQNPVERLNARLKAHLPEPDLLTKGSLSYHVYQAWHTVDSEVPPERFVGRVRPLPADQRRLLEFDSFQLVAVENGICEVVGSSFDCGPCDPDWPLLLARRGEDHERGSGPPDVELFDFRVALHKGEGRPRLSSGLSQLREVAATNLWLDQEERHQEVLRRLELPAVERLSQEASRAPVRRPRRPKNRDDSEGAQKSAVEPPLFEEFVDAPGGHCQEVQDQTPTSLKAPGLSDPGHAPTAPSDPQAGTPECQIHLVLDEQPTSPQSETRARRIIVDIPGFGTPIPKGTNSIPFLEKYQEWANVCPWGSALPVFASHPDLRDVCSATGLLTRAHPVRLLQDPSSGYSGGVPIADGPDVYYQPALARSRAEVECEVERQLLQRLNDLLARLLAHGTTAPMALSLVRQAIEVASQAREIAVGRATSERLARMVLGLEQTELMIQGGRWHRAIGRLRYIRNQAPYA
jgi:hypothetical protein